MGLLTDISLHHSEVYVNFELDVEMLEWDRTGKAKFLSYLHPHDFTTI